MTRKSIRIAFIFAVAALLIGLVMALDAREAFAEDIYPEPQDIYIDCDPLNTGNRNFQYTSLFYHGSGVFNNENTNYKAYYNPSLGTLFLKGYNGAAIRVKNSSGKKLTICINGYENSKITTDRQFGIIAEGVTLIFTENQSLECPTLTVNCNYTFSINGSGAGITNRWAEASASDIFVKDDLHLIVNCFANGHAYGIRPGRDLFIQGGSSVDVNAMFGTETHGDSAAVYAFNGVVVNTTGAVNFSAAARDKWKGEEKGWAVYCESGDLNVLPGAEYVSLSSVGANRGLYNKTLAQMNVSTTGYYDLSERSGTHSARMLRNKDYVYTEWLPLNGFFFPDPAFRELARDLAGDVYGWNIVYDLSDDVSTINLNDGNRDRYKDAYSLKGIENFSGLESLIWPIGYIKELDLPYTYPQLDELDVFGNYLEHLDLSRQTELTDLCCGNNQLTELDVSNCTKLKYLYCFNKDIDYSYLLEPHEFDPDKQFNSIGELDVSMCKSLCWLSCYGNDMKALRLGNNSNLQVLYCYNYNEPLEMLDLSGCPYLKNTYLYYDEKDYEDDPEYVLYCKFFDEVEKTGTMGIDEETKVITSTPTKYATLKAANLTLEGKISINFKVQTSASGMTAKLYYQKNGYDLVKTVPLNNSVWHSEDGGYYLVTYDQIPAKEMMLYLMIKVYDSAGNPVMLKTSSDWWTAYKYKVADWCNNKIKSSSNAKEVKLAKAMLNYGHYTQIALGYNDGNYGRPNKLANPNGYLASEMNSVTANSSYSSVVAGGTALGAKAFALVLESDTSIKLKLKRLVNVKIDGVAVTPQSEKDNDGSTIYCVYKNGIPAKKLHERSRFTLTEGSSTVTLQYGALSWANSKLAGSNVNDKNLARAMYLYNAAARSYFNY